jgi:hypothetical protein
MPVRGPGSISADAQYRPANMTAVSAFACLLVVCGETGALDQSSDTAGADAVSGGKVLL